MVVGGISGQKMIVNDLTKFLLKTAGGTPLRMVEDEEPSIKRMGLLLNCLSMDPWKNWI